MQQHIKKKISVHKFFSKFYKNISPYMPEHILNLILTKPPEYIFKPRYVEYTLLYADLSGFTTLTEELSEQGKEGAESLTKIINTIFSNFILILRNYGGSVLKFGGDSLFVMFPEDFNNISLAKISALKAAIEIIKFIKRKDSFDIAGKRYKLAVKIGLNCGKVCSIIAGSEIDRKEYFITGIILNDLIRAESFADKFQIVITENMRNFLTAQSLPLTEIKKGFYLIKSIIPPKLDEKKLPVQCLPAFRRDYTYIQYGMIMDKITPFLPKQLYKEIMSLGGKDELYSRFRKVTAIFINLIGLTEMAERNLAHCCDNIYKISELYFSQLMKVVEKYNGTFQHTDVCDCGDKFIIFFGAPISNENDDLLALKCAVELRDMLKELNLELTNQCKSKEKKCRLYQKIGINTGTAFCGIIGSHLRKEYTVMGDSINVAARLMNIADINKIYVGRETIIKYLDYFKTVPKKAFLKGKKNEFEYYEVLDIKSEIYTKSTTGYKGLFIGRESEITELKKILDETDNASKFNKIAILGEAGIGKSSLIEEILRYCQNKKWRIIITEGAPYNETSPYYFWINTLKNIFVAAGNGNLNAGIKKLEKRYKIKYMPIIAALIGEPHRDNKFTSRLSDEKRKIALFEGIKSIIFNISKHQPTLIVFEDIHWIDNISFELLDYILKLKLNKCRLAFLVSSRYVKTERFKYWQEYEDYYNLKLREFSMEETASLIRLYPHCQKLTESMIKKIYRQTAGNPFFISEIIALINENKGKQQIPDSVLTLILSRIDNLKESEKFVLTIASVIGRIFNKQIIIDIIHFYKFKYEIDLILENLCKKNLIYSLDEVKCDLYSFRHDLTVQTVYTNLGVKLRSEIHFKIANWYEKNESDNIENVLEIVAHHFYEASDIKNAIKYLLMSGNKSKKVYANEQAIEFYTKAIQMVALRLKKVSLSIKTDLIKLFYNRGLIYRLTGKYKESIDDFLMLYNLSAAMKDKHKIAVALNYIGGAYRWKGDQKNALKYCLKALKIAKANNYIKILATCYNSLSVIYWYLGDYKKAINSGKKSMDIRKKMGDISKISGGLFSLGNSYFKICDYKNAKKCFSLLYNLSLKSNDKIGVGYALDGLGNCFQKSGQVSKCLKNHKKTFNIRINIGDYRGVVYSLLNMSDMYLLIGDWRTALDRCNKASEFSDKIQDDNLKSDVLRNLGKCYLHSKKYSESKVYLDKSLELAKFINFRESIIKTNETLANLAFTVDDISNAIKYTETVLRLSHKSGMQDFYCSALLIRGLIFLKTGFQYKAFEKFKIAYNTAVKLNLPFLMIQTYICFIKYYRYLNRSIELVKYQKKTKKIINKILNNIRDKKNIKLFKNYCASLLQ